MRRSSFLAFALVVLVLAPRLASAEQAETGSITVEKAWSRATPAGAEVAAGYLTIVNNGDTPDRLVSVSTSVAGKTEIHQMKMADGKMEMRPVPDGVPIPAKGSVVLEPAGYHLMFMGLKAPLQKGSTFGASLAFEHAGTIDVTFQVEGLGASGPTAP